jgi:hypothetical protein
MSSKSTAPVSLVFGGVKGASPASDFSKPLKANQYFGPMAERPDCEKLGGGLH